MKPLAAAALLALLLVAWWALRPRLVPARLERWEEPADGIEPDPYLWGSLYERVGA